MSAIIVLCFLLVAVSESYLIPAPQAQASPFSLFLKPLMSGASTSLHGPSSKLFSEPEMLGDSPSSLPLIDLQTFLKLTQTVQSGGEAKILIQGGEVCLNGESETRRSKKLFDGDVVSLPGEEITLDVKSEVDKRGYVMKQKKPKALKDPKNGDNDDNEFKGAFRSEEWREERRKRKYERKASKKEKLSRWDHDLNKSTAAVDEATKTIIQELVMKREQMRASRKYEEADDARVHLEMDYSVAVDDKTRMWWVDSK